jgi:hypothetical protein
LQSLAARGALRFARVLKSETLGHFASPIAEGIQEMPHQWRLYIYCRSRAGATPEQLQNETGLPAEEIALRVEAARLCFEKQCLVASRKSPIVIPRMSRLDRNC